MAKLRRHTSFRELKSDGLTTTKPDANAFKDYKAFIELLQNSLATKKSANTSSWKNKNG